MKRLRHPIRAIEEPFGKAGLVVAVIALIAALGGTAFAAAKLNSTQKKEVEKIAKKFAGKPGANGTNGTNGAPGEKGANGSNGSAGAAGSNGTNVTSAPASVGECSEGGTKFTSASGTEKVCNGLKGKSVNVEEIEAEPGELRCEERGGAEVKKEGALSGTEVCNGKEGSPWTAGGTLPPNATETGEWSVNGIAQNEGEFLTVPISFSIPLKEAPNAVYVPLGETAPAACEGGTIANPVAKPGNLCIFEGAWAGVENEEEELELITNGLNFFAIFRAGSKAEVENFENIGAGTTGALVGFMTTKKEGAAVSAVGSWAVTGKE